MDVAAKGGVVVETEREEDGVEVEVAQFTVAIEERGERELKGAVMETVIAVARAIWAEQPVSSIEPSSLIFYIDNLPADNARRSRSIRALDNLNLQTSITARSSKVRISESRFILIWTLIPETLKRMRWQRKLGRVAKSLISISSTLAKLLIQIELLVLSTLATIQTISTCDSLGSVVVSMNFGQLWKKSRPVPFVMLPHHSTVSLLS